MLLGLLADIHEAVEPLREALGVFARLGVEEVVVLGDICETHRRLEETVSLLREARAVGVWGNHDFGLCRDITDDVRARLHRVGGDGQRHDLESCPLGCPPG